MITVSGVGKKFNHKWLFQDVSFEVPAQQSHVLLGPSGSGKSVLLKLISGLLEPDQGEISVDTQNLGMLFQKNALFDSLTIEENLLFPLKEACGITGKEAKTLAHQFLKSVGLSGTESLFPDEISGGMQKRLGIARALVVRPKVILYDEPTAGLDPITSRVITDLIRNLAVEFQSTLLMVTNDIQRAYQIGDQIYYLADGKLKNGGTSQEIKKTKDPHIRQFIYGLRELPS